MKGLLALVVCSFVLFGCCGIPWNIPEDNNATHNNTPITPLPNVTPPHVNVTPPIPPAPPAQCFKVNNTVFEEGDVVLLNAYNLLDDATNDSYNEQESLNVTEKGGKITVMYKLAFNPSIDFDSRSTKLAINSMNGEWLLYNLSGGAKLGRETSRVKFSQLYRLTMPLYYEEYTLGNYVISSRSIPSEDASAGSHITVKEAGNTLDELDLLVNETGLAPNSKLLFTHNGVDEHFGTVNASYDVSVLSDLINVSSVNANEYSAGKYRLPEITITNTYDSSDSIYSDTDFYAVTILKTDCP